MITIEIRFNHITIRYNNTVVEHHGMFSNSHLIIADGFQWMTALIAAAGKAADQGIFEQQNWSTHKLITSESDNQPNRPCLCFDVCETLEGGLSPVEWYILINTLEWINPKNTMKQPEILILYRDKPPTYEEALQAA